MTAAPAPITAREQADIDRANASGRQPVVFVHGLWLLAGSWDAWREYVEEKGYTAIVADWPDDALSVAEAREHPERFAGKTIGAIAEHVALVLRALDRPPVLIGHSFGGLLVQKLAGLGLAAATVAIDPAPYRGVLPLPLSSLKAAFPVVGNPANRTKAIALTFEQFRFAFANAVPEAEARSLYETFHVAGSGIPLFQAALANFVPGTEASVDTRNPRRGPLLVISGEKDNTAPHAIAHYEYRLAMKRNPGVAAFTEIPGRGHSLVIDAGWKDVADAALAFLADHVPAE